MLGELSRSPTAAISPFTRHRGVISRYQWWGKIGLWKKTKNGLPEAVLVDFHTDFRCG
jgi:hypothetical protein